jgi:hypothetical protein
MIFVILRRSAMFSSTALQTVIYLMYEQQKAN